jgi:protein TonB
VRRIGKEGEVIIEFIVNKDGDVESAKVLQSVIEPLDEICLNAVKELKFTPGMQRGKPVKVKMKIPINFKLK